MIWGGFEGFGPCLGISHPTHPHLGEISQKTFFWRAFFNSLTSKLHFSGRGWVWTAHPFQRLLCPHHRQGRHFCQVLCSLVNFLNISSKVMKTNIATDSLGATTVRSLPLLGKSSPRLLRRMSRLNNNEHDSKLGWGIFFTRIPLKHPKFPCNEVLGFHCFCSTF